MSSILHKFIDSHTSSAVQQVRFIEGLFVLLRVSVGPHQRTGPRSSSLPRRTSQLWRRYEVPPPRWALNSSWGPREVQGPKLQPPSQILAPLELLLLPPPLPTNAISPDILGVEIWRRTRYSEGGRVPFLVIGAARRQMAQKMAQNCAGLEPRPSFRQIS